MPTLSKNYRIKFLAKAWKTYGKAQLPPFVTRKQGASTVRSVIHVARQPGRPNMFSQAVITQRIWDENNVFYTIDLHDVRMILALVSGRPSWLKRTLHVAGAEYYSWNGSGFSTLPAAFWCESLTVRNSLSHPAFTTTGLPDGHIAERFLEARGKYHSDLPPFVKLTSNCCRDPGRIVVLADSTGKPSQPKKFSTLRIQPWNDDYSYVTLDQNGVRLVLIPERGPNRKNGGRWYRQWLPGPDSECSELPIAFGCTEDEAEGLRLLDEESSKPSLPQAAFVEKETKITENAAIIPESTEPPPLPAKEPSLFVGSEEEALTGTSPETDLCDASFHDEDGSSCSQESSDESCIEIPTRLPKRKSTHEYSTKADLPLIDSVKAIVEHDLKKYASNPIARRRDTQPPAKRLCSLSSAPTVAANLELPPAILFNMSPEKQARTILRVLSVGNKTAVVPLRLRSCMTISSFFESVITASGYSRIKESITSISATFHWKAEDDFDKTVCIKKELEDSFDYFLEIIDEAPCWDRGEKCNVALEIVNIGLEEKSQ